MAPASTKDVNPQQSDKDIAQFIKSSCTVTQYPQLCVSSLSSYAGSLKSTQRDLVKAAIDVSLVNARNVSVWAADLNKKNPKISESEKAALEDCIQNFEDTVKEIQQSLTEIQRLVRNTFKSQISDLQTWMSAALTYEETCLDGFEEVNATGEVTTLVTVRVQNVSEFISNALALLKAFAATGGDDGINV